MGRRSYFVLVQELHERHNFPELNLAGAAYLVSKTTHSSAPGLLNYLEPGIRVSAACIYYFCDLTYSYLRPS